MESLHERCTLGNCHHREDRCCKTHENVSLLFMTETYEKGLHRVELHPLSKRVQARLEEKTPEQPVEMKKLHERKNFPENPENKKLEGKGGGKQLCWRGRNHIEKVKRMTHSLKIWYSRVHNSQVRQLLLSEYWPNTQNATFSLCLSCQGWNSMYERWINSLSLRSLRRRFTPSDRFDRQ